MTATSITLEWSPGISSGVSAQEYVIYQRDLRIGETDGTTRFRDENLDPASAYRYSVVAQSGSMESGHSEVIRLKTRTPPLSAARLEGDWRVLYTVTDSNLSNSHPGKPLKFFWELDPRCEAGPCSAALFMPLARNPAKWLAHPRWRRV